MTDQDPQQALEHIRRRRQLLARNEVLKAELERNLAELAVIEDALGPLAADPALALVERNR